MANLAAHEQPAFLRRADIGLIVLESHNLSTPTARDGFGMLA